MKILLLAMPDSVDLIDNLVKIPNIALVSLAGNMPEHEVKVMDLVGYGKKIRKPLTEAINHFQPEIVGLSAMTFQFATAMRIAAFIRENYPEITLVAGGYHVSLMAEELGEQDPPLPLDFMIRGEGEQAFPALCEELGKSKPDFSRVEGLSFKDQDKCWIHNPRGELLDLAEVKLPDRSNRIFRDFKIFKNNFFKIDVIETSRGCPFVCKFCSIRQMYGKTFRTFSIDRIIQDLKNIKAAGRRGIFIVDDNITYDIDHFRKLCQAIVEHKLNHLFYSVQVTAAGIANNPELVADMDKANFRFIFVGYESMLPATLTAMKKPTNPEINVRAAKLLRQHNMSVIAGVIVGYPDDTRETVSKNFRGIIKLLPDLVYPQYLTPYPKTELREQMLADDLVVNKDDFSRYDGYTCNIRTRHLSPRDLYVALRKEMFLNFFYPSIMWNHLLARYFPYMFFRTIYMNLLMITWNILTGGGRERKFDI